MLTHVIFLITMDEYSGFMPEGLKVESYENLTQIGEENISTAFITLIL